MKTVIIDVRTRKEYFENSIPGAINIPSNSLTIDDFSNFRNDHICLVCEGGIRANSVYKLLKRHGFRNVSLLNKHMEQLKDNLANDRVWTIDRQFRLIISLLLIAFLTGIYFGIAAFWGIPIIIAAGMLYSAITDNCYMKILIANFPWNRKEKFTKAKIDATPLTNTN